MTRKTEANGHCYISCEIRRVTERAVLIHDGAREAWIPISQIEDPDTDDLGIGKHVELLLPEWLAHDKGLI